MPRWILLLALQLSIGCTRLRAQAPPGDSIPQKDLVDVLLRVLHKNGTDSGRRKNAVLFSIIPIAPLNVGQKQAAVSSINVAFYTGNPSSTNISSIYFVPYTNFSNRSGFLVTPNIWLDQNRWNLSGDLRITKNAYETYGLGAQSQKGSQDIIDYRYARVYLNANHKVVGPFNIGLGYNLDYFYQVQDSKTHGYPNVFSDYGPGTGPQTTSSGITFNLLFDGRKNSINPSGGFYSSFIYRINPSFLANDFKWESIYFDTRKYFSLSDHKRSILGIWLLYWGCYGDVPYLDLPGTSLDPAGRTGRGYALGRYRGKQLLYGETEYRFDISRDGLWGGVVFCNLQSYTEPASGAFAYLLPAAGTGVRVKFNKRSGTNLTFDVAAGKNSFNWYLNLGEFF